MASEQGSRPLDRPGQAVVELLTAEGPTLPIVVVARRTGIAPTRLAPILDELYEAGLVTPGAERGTVALAPGSAPSTGRFTRAGNEEIAESPPHRR